MADQTLYLTFFYYRAYFGDHFGEDFLNVIFSLVNKFIKSALASKARGRA